MSTVGVLTDRELELLELAADGHTRVEIGRRVYLSPETVKSHMLMIRLKLGARNIPHAVALGFRQGLLS